MKGAGLTIGLCFLVAVLEGLDIQAMGVAAPKLGAELKLAREILGRALASSNIGLVAGASLGGWLADRIGRKPVLIAAVATFGAFTLATMFAWNYEWLFAARLGAGLGFGAALPNIMAMAAEVSAPEKRGASATMMFCGMPFGGGTVALISWLTPNQNWRVLFLIGGLAPLLIVPVLWRYLRETHVASQSMAGQKSSSALWLALVPLYAACYFLIASIGKLPGAGSLAAMPGWLAVPLTVVIAYALVHRQPLFGEGRAFVSVLLWIIFLPTLLILYLILNWLPSLVVAKGFPQGASQAAVWFNYASVVGALLCGRLLDRFGVRWPLLVSYLGLIGVLVALSQATTLPSILVLSGASGFFLIGANYALYGAAASYYPQSMRGRGSGAAVAWGRLGSVAGPLAGGYLLASGTSAGGVVASMVPFAATAAIGVFILSFLARRAD